MTVGNGQSTLFWEDRLIDGHSVGESATTLWLLPAPCVGPALITAECSPTVDDETFWRNARTHHVQSIVDLCTYMQNS
jgi:hypothetical protein